MFIFSFTELKVESAKWTVNCPLNFLHWQHFCSKLRSVTFRFPLPIFNCANNFAEVAACSTMSADCPGYFSMLGKDCQRMGSGENGRRRGFFGFHSLISGKFAFGFVHLCLTTGQPASKMYSVWCTLPQFGVSAFHDNRRNKPGVCVFRPVSAFAFSSAGSCPADCHA